MTPSDGYDREGTQDASVTRECRIRGREMFQPESYGGPLDEWFTADEVDNDG